MDKWRVPIRWTNHSSYSRSPANHQSYQTDVPSLRMVLFTVGGCLELLVWCRDWQMQGWRRESPETGPGAGGVSWLRAGSGLRAPNSHWPGGCDLTLESVRFGETLPQSLGRINGDLSCQLPMVVISLHYYKTSFQRSYRLGQLPSNVLIGTCI